MAAAMTTDCERNSLPRSVGGRGFETKWLRTTAQQLGRTPDANLASLGLIEECLNGLGYAEDDARNIVAPLKTAHALRTDLKGHASGDEAVAIRKQTLAEHGSYKKHFRVLTGEIDQSIRAIEDAFEKSSKSAKTGSALIGRYDSQIRLLGVWCRVDSDLMIGRSEICTFRTAFGR